MALQPGVAPEAATADQVVGAAIEDAMIETAVDGMVVQPWEMDGGPTIGVCK